MAQGEHENGPGNRQRNGEERGPSPLTFLLVAALLIAGGYFLLVKLHDMARLQDCVMAGHRNCAPIEAPPRR